MSVSALRYRHLALAAVATVLVLATASDRGFDLDFLVAAAHYLAGHSTGYFGRLPVPSTGLHLYAANPAVQVGPLTLLYLLAAGVGWGDPGHIACLVATLLGLVAIVLVERAADNGQRPLPTRAAATTLLGGIAICVCWADTVQRWGHVDDALVAFLAAAAVLAVRRERSVLAGLLIGLAIGAKPTALPLVVLLLTAPGAPAWPLARARLQALAIAGLTAAVAYLPFVIAAPGTLKAGAPQLAIQPASVLSLFGATVGTQSPALIRVAQLVLALALGYWAARRNGAMAGLLAVSAARLLLDPGDYSYYALPLVLAAVGIAVQRRGLPTFAWVATAALVILPWADPARHRWEGAITLVVCLAAVALAVRPQHRSAGRRVDERADDRGRAPRPHVLADRVSPILD